MALRSDHNEYPGINAHLNSYLQNESGGWESFHGDHIRDLARHIDRRLPVGYFVRCQASLAGESLEIDGVVIYQLDETDAPGRPITRLELLSPANKPGGSHHGQFLLKRGQTLSSGLRLVEIDHLHQLRPVVAGVPSYPEREAGAYPYWVMVSDPRPSLEEGQLQLYGVGVLDALPVVEVPLAEDDSVLVDFGQPYNATYESLQFFRMMVDYAQEPVEMGRYWEDDRERIRSHLQSVVDRLKA